MRRIILALSMLIGVWLGAAISAPSASAATNCDMAVVDFTSSGVLGDTSRIEVAIDQLENQGVDVRVRAFETAPSGGLEAYQKEQVKTCSSWQDPDGYTKGNLMTFLFSMDRQSAIFYGSNLEAELADDVDRIRADYMNAEFRNGNFSEGIIGAISESANVIDEYNHPSPDVSTGDDSSTSSSDSNVFGWVMGVLGGLVILALLAFGIYKLLQFRRRRKEEWQDANERAYSAANAANTELVKLGEGYGVRQTAETLFPKLSEEDQGVLETLLGEYGGEEEDAQSRANVIAEDPATYSLEKRRSTEEYRAIAKAHDSVYMMAAEAVHTLGMIKGLCTEKEDAIARAPETLQTRRATLDELSAKCATLEQEGYRFTLTESFAKAGVLLEGAEREINAKRYGEALDELDDSQGYLEDVQRILTRVPEWHQELQREHAALTAELSRVKTGVATAMEIRAEITSQFTDCDKGLLEESEVASLISRATLSLTEAHISFSMERQHWAAADQRLSACERMLGELRQGVIAIDSRMSALSALEGSLDSRFGNIDSAIARCMNSCNSREGGQGEFTQRLRSTERKLGELRGYLRVDKPNLLHLDNELTMLKSKVESIDSESEEEDRRERRRREEEARRRRREQEEAERRRRNASISASSLGSFGGGSRRGGGGGRSHGGGSSGGW